MRAIVMRAFGGPEVLELEQLEDPRPGPGEVVVEVAAVEVSPTRDASTRTGRHPFSRQVTLPHVLGGDCAGTVVAAGDGVGQELVGRRVAVSNAVPCQVCANCRAAHDDACLALQLIGVHRTGSYAELVSVPEGNVTPLADEVDLLHAAAFAADGPIAYAQLLAGDVQEGTRVLVTGAGGALGSTLVAMAADRGAEVIALSRRPPKLLARWGAAATVSTDAPDLADALLELTGGAGLQVVIDNVALAEPFAAYMTAMATRGRVVMSGAMSPDPVSFVPQRFYVKSLSIVGVRTESRATRARFWDEVAGGLRLPDEALEAMPLEDAAKAHRHVESGAKLGHLLLEMTPGR